MGQSSGQQGFTLIELLIVISLLSVLSLFGISTSKRAIDRAKNIRKIANIKSAVNTVSGYTASNSTLPQPLEDVRNGGSTYTACLGKTTSDQDSDGLSGCHVVASGGYEEDDTLNTALRTINQEVPIIDDSGINFGSNGVFWGAALVYFDSTSNVTVNGVVRRVWVMYALSGINQTCESFGGEVVDGGTLPNWTSSAPTNRGLQINNNTICYVALTQEFGR